METIFNMQEEPIITGIVENLKIFTPDELREISIFVQAYKFARTTQISGKSSIESA